MVWKSESWSSQAKLETGPSNKSISFSTPKLARKSANLFPSHVICLKEIAWFWESQLTISSSLWAILQLLLTLWIGDPCISFVTIFIIIYESPSMMSGKKPLACARFRPRHNPSNSSELLVSQPFEPRKVNRGMPWWSLKTPPYPACPGLPFEVPSKLSWNILLGGGTQLVGMLELLVGMSRYVDCWFKWNFQLVQIDFSYGSEG